MTEGIIATATELGTFFPTGNDITPADISRIAIVVPNADRREVLQKELDPTGERFRVIAANQIIAGMRFNAVIVTDDVSRIAFLKGRTARDKLQEWLTQVGKHCVNNAKVIHL